MPSQLIAVNLTNFTGGINVRRNDFNLDPNESPRMLNMEVDPRGGFFTRRGWQRVNTADTIGVAADFDPQQAWLHLESSGAQYVFLASDNKVYSINPSYVSTDLSVTATADPHQADFASWGDTLYMALGHGNRAAKWVNTGTVTPLGPATIATPIAWNDDYTTPLGGVVPPCDHMAVHGGYLFVADTTETDVNYPNRVRFSHPDQPEDFAADDYIDILEGGGRITGLLSFNDHLLIFKQNSMWALYGYDLDSFQLIKISSSIGAPSPKAITRSDTAAYFFSGSARSGIYGYQGEGPVHLTEKLRSVMEEIAEPQNTWVCWIGRRLWTSLPWKEDGTGGYTNFVFDPEIGAWVLHRSAQGSLSALVERSDVSAEYPLGCVIGVSGETPLVRLDFAPAASDYLDSSLTATPFDAFYTTGWHYLDQPESRKGWRRPRFIMREPNEAVTIDVDTFWNYDEASPKRSHSLQLTAEGTVFWRLTGALEPGGFDWGDGALWGSSEDGGASIERAQPSGGLGGLGWARSVQLRFTTAQESAGKAWGIDAMILKVRTRRFTT